MADPTFPSPLDFYETNQRDVEVLLPHLAKPAMWIDLGCGRGAIGKALHAHWGVRGVGVEFLPERADQAIVTCAYDAVVRGDIADADVWTSAVDAAARLARGAGGWLVIANPPFQQWELFASRAAEVGDEAALLLPAMAFERRKTRTSQYVQRWKHISAANVGRYDLADRPTFGRRFVGDDGLPYVDWKGTAASAYAWWVRGANHAGKWRILESEVRP